jgi:glycosyltransferase involved in cell wall biosynthesis
MAQNKPKAVFENYLEKHFPQFRIETPPPVDLKLIVVIPSYLEKNFLFKTLESLYACTPPSGQAEVIIVLNTSEDDTPDILEKQKECFTEIQNFKNKKSNNWLHIHPLEAYNLRKKHFGAGLARKTGLDEAVRRYHEIGKPDGIITCLDADSPVAPNYFRAIEEWYKDPLHQGAMIYFEHPLKGKEYPSEVYEAITLYELHLRYYLQSLRAAGFPYAYHTIGSCMTFRASKYVQAGGMPKKQAGEDFYFLQKLIPLGGFGEINNTAVYPSPRPSDRVVFGTGASIKQHLKGSRRQGTTYNPLAFEDLGSLFSKIQELRDINTGSFEEWTYNLSGPLRSFLLNSNFREELSVIRKNSNSNKTFLKRFFGVFNAFRIVKYLNYSHEHFYAKKDVFDAALSLLEQAGQNIDDILDEKELLIKYRELERKRIER